jgi:dolichol-phosphate mannosyltransferase
MTKVSLLKQLLLGHGSRFLRFGLVGASGVLVNYALLYGLADVVGLNHLMAAAVATEAAILNNFTFNNVWTFGDVRPKARRMRRMLQYNLFCLGGLVVSITVLAALTYLLHMHYLVANLFAIGAATLSNYSTSHYWTWRAASFVEDAETVVKDEMIRSK